MLSVWANPPATDDRSRRTNPMTTTTPRRGARAGLTVLALTAAMAVLAPAALAQSESQGDGTPGGQGGNRPHPQLTDEQKACLEQAGVEKPAQGQPPTEEQRAAFRTAAQQCNIPLPRGRHHLRLTDEQKQCLQDAGVEKPTQGQRPSDEQREAFRAAAEKCGIDLPQRPRLTDEQQQCLKDAGVEKPAAGQPPTDEQRDAFRAAAEKCGIDLPDRPNGPPPGAPEGTGDNQSTAV
jgi:Spy/CpxP family protein refolding chaperone